MTAKYSSSDPSDFQPLVRDKLQVQPAASTQVGRTENPEVTGAGKSKRKLNRSWDNTTYSPLKYPRHAVRENEFQRAPRSEIGSRYLLNSTPLDSPDRRKNFKSPDGADSQYLCGIMWGGPLPFCNWYMTRAHAALFLLCF